MFEGKNTRIILVSGKNNTLKIKKKSVGFHENLLGLKPECFNCLTV